MSEGRSAVVRSTHNWCECLKYSPEFLTNYHEQQTNSQNKRAFQGICYRGVNLCCDKWEYVCGSADPFSSTIEILLML